MKMPVSYNPALCRIGITFIVVALCVTTPVSAARIDELGRLFTDRIQRERLEAVRHGAYDKQVVNSNSVTDVMINGMMLRSDGKSVVWVNGKSTLDRQPGGGVKVHTNAADHNNYSVPVVVDGKYLRMKPGQRWSEGSEIVRDDY